MIIFFNLKKLKYRLDKKSGNYPLFYLFFLYKKVVFLIKFGKGLKEKYNLKGIDVEIVVEYVFLQNLFIDYLIFKTTAGILRTKGKYFFLVSIFASIFAVVLPLFYLPKIFEFILKIFLGVLLVCLTFKFNKFLSFLKIYVTFFFATFLYGGVCACFVETFGQLHTLIILAIVAVTYCIFEWLLKYINKRKTIENFCYDVLLENGDKVLNCKGFLDTGNMLVDPLTKKPVCLVGLKLFEELGFEIDFKDLLTKNFDLKKLSLGHYICLDTVGQGNKVLAFEVDKILVKGKEEVKKPMLAVCLKNFSNYEIILNNCFAWN